MKIIGIIKTKLFYSESGYCCLRKIVLPTVSPSKIDIILIKDDICI